MPGQDPKREWKLGAAALLALAVVFFLVPRLLGGREREAGGLGPPSAAAPLAEDAPRAEEAAVAPTARAEPARPRPAPAAPQATVEVQGGPSPSGIHGRVTDESGAPIAGALVRLHAEMAGFRGALGVVRTDRDGRYELEVDLTELWEATGDRARDELDGLHTGLGLELQGEPEELRLLQTVLMASYERRLEAARVVAEVAVPGMQSARVERALPREPGGPMRLDVRMHAGAGLGGRVFYRGQPLPFARVQVYDELWQHVDSTDADENGEFELGLPEAGQYRVHARCDGLGASGTSVFTLGAELTPLVVDLDLAGDASLALRVLLPDGTPIPFLELEALQYGLLQSELFGGAPTTPGDVARAESSGGLAHSIRRGDEDGAVLFTGLQDGRFGIRIPSLRDDGLQPAQEFATGALEHALELDVWLLLVEIDPLSRRRGRAGDGPQPRPAARILVEPTSAGGGASGRKPLRAFGGAFGGTCFVVEPGESYRVLAHGESGDAETRVAIDPARRITTVSLWLGRRDARIERAVESGRADPPGTVELVVRDERGERWHELDVAIEGGDVRESAAAGVALSAGRTAVLAPGEYAASVRLRGRLAATHCLAPGAARFTVRDDQPCRVELRAVAGARLELELAPLAGPEAGGEQGARPPELAVEVVLRPLGGAGPELRPEFTPEAASFARRALWPGERARSELLPAGRYELSVEGQLLGAAPVEVDLRVSRAARVELELAPRARPGNGPGGR